MRNFQQNITKFIKQAANGQKFELKPSLINYITEVNLPRPAKMVVPANASLHHSGFMVRVSGNLAEILENNTNTGIKVRY